MISAKRMLSRRMVLNTLGLVMDLYAGANSVALGNGGCIAGADPAEPCNVIQGSANNAVPENVKGGTIGGGGGLDFPNQVTKDYGTVSGGLGNQAGDQAVVAGGASNIANGFRAAIGGGFGNKASGESSTIGGGYNNITSSYRTAVAGGTLNVAESIDAAVGGGSSNIAAGADSTVTGTSVRSTPKASRSRRFKG